MKLLCNQNTIPQKPVASRNKRTFSLIELLVCLALITMLGGIFAFKGAQLWQHYQYQNEINRFVEALQLSRHLSQSLRADIDIELVVSPKGMWLMRDMDEPQLLKMPHYFPSQELFSHLHLEENISLSFHGNGGFYSPRTIEVIDKKNKKTTIQIKKFLK